MKENDRLDILFSDKDSDIELISGAYPAAGDKEKERIYKISKRKYNMQKNADEHDGDYIKQAEGVEQYRRPKWYRGFCAAAAAVVLVGGTVGTAMLTGKGKLLSTSENDQMTSLSNSEMQDRRTDNADDIIDELLGNLQLFDGLFYGKGTDSADQLIYYVPVGYNEFDTEEFDDSAVNYVDPALGKQSREPVASFFGNDLGEYKVQSGNGRSDMDRLIEESEQRVSDNIRQIEVNIGGYTVAYDNDSVTYQGDYNVYTYSKVTDPRFDTMEELKDFASSFMVVNDERVFGDDFSEYPSETVFESSVMLSDFIEYKGSVYSHIMQGEQFMRFDEYEIISTDYRFEVPDGAEENYCMTDGDFTFERVYRIDDDTALYCSFTVIKDESDSRYKISSWSISEGVNEFDKNDDKPQEQETDEPDEQEEYNSIWLRYNGLPVVHEIDHALSIIEDEKKVYEERGIFKVDTRPYINMLLSAETDEELNTLENKSYIYHIMLNSVDYYETAQGSMKCEEREIQFRTDLTDQYAYSHVVKDGLELEYFTIDGVTYNKVPSERVYTFVNTYTEREHIPDYARVFKTHLQGYYCHPLNEITHIGEEALFPQGIAMQRLCEPDWWSIVGIETYLGRQCAVIEGESEEVYGKSGYFRLWTDIETGIVLKAYEGSVDSEPTIEVYELELNAPIEKTPFDAEDYEYRQSTVGLRTDKSDE